MKNSLSQSRCKVIDAQEVVPNEIWRITTENMHAEKEICYVLESTCEVIGGTTSTRREETIRLRSDWSTYIAGHSHDTAQGRRSESLMSHLAWTNHEEYAQGISKLWINRIKREGQPGNDKMEIAKKYILACVVSNR